MIWRLSPGVPVGSVTLLHAHNQGWSPHNLVSMASIERSLDAGNRLGKGGGGVAAGVPSPALNQEQIRFSQILEIQKG